jgi:hypothetical protein
MPMIEPIANDAAAIVGQNHTDFLNLAYLYVALAIAHRGHNPDPRHFPLLYYHFICWLVPTVLDYCAFAGVSGRTAATPFGLMLKAKKVKGSPPGFPH